MFDFDGFYDFDDNDQPCDNAEHVAGNATSMGDRTGSQIGGTTSDLSHPIRSSTQPSGPLRVLCLHGACSNGRIMKVQLNRVNRILKGRAEFVFVNGPFPSAEDDLYHEQRRLFKDDEFFHHCHVPRTGLGSAIADPRPIDGLDGDVVVPALQAHVRENAPIHGILGFSQGAAVASVMAALAEAGEAPSLQFVIHVCAPQPGWPAQRPDLFKRPLTMRSLHISGKKDPRGLLPLVSLYESPASLTHADGHRILPSTSVAEADEVANAIVDFILEGHT